MIGNHMWYDWIVVVLIAGITVSQGVKFVDDLNRDAPWSTIFGRGVLVAFLIHAFSVVTS